MRAARGGAGRLPRTGERGRPRPAGRRARGAPGGTTTASLRGPLRNETHARMVAVAEVLARDGLDLRSRDLAEPPEVGDLVLECPGGLGLPVGLREPLRPRCRTRTRT